MNPTLNATREKRFYSTANEFLYIVKFKLWHIVFFEGGGFSAEGKGGFGLITDGFTKGGVFIIKDIRHGGMGDLETMVVIEVKIFL